MARRGSGFDRPRSWSDSWAALIATLPRMDQTQHTRIDHDGHSVEIEVGPDGLRVRIDDGEWSQTLRLDPGLSPEERARAPRRVEE